jgi:hypothetical protein
MDQLFPEGLLIGIPSPNNFLKTRDIQVPVVQERAEFGTKFCKELSVVRDGVSSQSSSLNVMLVEQVKELLINIFYA